MRAREGERGFTLIELMVALLVSSLMVGMILAIFTRMSLSYRSQQAISEVQQKLATARAWIETDAKQAGFAMSQGFRVATDVGDVRHSPITITNSSAGPDTLEIYYADASAQALVIAPTNGAGNWPVRLLVDDASGFVANDLIVLSVSTLVDGLNPGYDGKVASFSACVLRIQSVAANAIELVTSAPWGTATQSHCDVPSLNRTMVYKLVAHAYRIDPARPGEGALQLSRTGNLNSLAAFEDIGYNFTDLQLAAYFYDGGGDTGDLDVDAARDWYSSTELQTLTEAQVAPLTPMLQLGITLVARTGQDMDGVTTAQTPSLVGTPVTNNMLGDRAAVDLATTTDPTLQGNRVYRYTTTYVDLRNMGVGR